MKTQINLNNLKEVYLKSWDYNLVAKLAKLKAGLYTEDGKTGSYAEGGQVEILDQVWEIMTLDGLSFYDKKEIISAELENNWFWHKEVISNPKEYWVSLQRLNSKEPLKAYVSQCINNEYKNYAEIPLTVWTNDIADLSGKKHFYVALVKVCDLYDVIAGKSDVYIDFRPETNKKRKVDNYEYVVVKTDVYPF